MPGHVLHPEFAEALRAAWTEAADAFEVYADALVELDTVLGSSFVDGYTAVAAAGVLLAALDRLQQITRSTCQSADWQPHVEHGAAALVRRS